MRKRVRTWIPKCSESPGNPPPYIASQGLLLPSALLTRAELPVLLTTRWTSQHCFSFMSLRLHPHWGQVAPHLTSRSSMIPQFLPWTGIALVPLRTSQCHHPPHHLPGKSWLISSISSTISYGTPASASSTLSWPGIRPATGWIPNLDGKWTNSWPYWMAKTYRDPEITSQSAQSVLGPSDPPGTASSLQAEVESARIWGRFTNIDVGDSESQYHTH